MINLQLRRAVLAAAVIASLSIRAAAQSDVALSTAPDKRTSGPAKKADLKTQPQVPPEAPAQGQPIPDDAWMKIINTVRQEGTFELPKPGSKLGTYTIIKSRKDPKSEYTNMGIDLLTEPVRSETIHIAAVRFAGVTVSAAGTDNILKSWEFITNYQGRLQSATYSVTTVSRKGAITNETSTDLDISDPKVKARYDEIIKYWTGR